MIKAPFVECVCLPAPRRVSHGWLVHLIFTLWLFGLPGAQLSYAGDVIASEYKLKAALLYKLTWFVEWPGSGSVSEPKTFDLCILGDNGFGDLLKPLQRRELKGLPIKVNYYQLSENIGKGCELVFISKSKQPFLKGILNQLEGTETLTVSDINGFAQMGGMIEFRQDEASIGFNINLQQSRKEALRIAAPLLEMANVVSTKD